MIRILLHGCMGAMGQALCRIISETPDLQIAAGVDIRAAASAYAFPVYENFEQCTEEADVLIDFSIAQAADAVLKVCAERKLPLVMATTGLSAEQMEMIRSLSETVPVVQSYNMSLGINLLVSLVKEAAPVLADAGFDIEIVEQHHNKKADAPSGTAILLADAAKEALDDGYFNIYDRTGRRSRRDPKEIGISSVRGGTITGIHDVIFAGEDEVVTLKHQAFSKAVFAKGAVAAAKFLQGRENGLYDMQDVIRG